MIWNRTLASEDLFHKTRARISDIRNRRLCLPDGVLSMSAGMQKLGRLVMASLTSRCSDFFFSITSLVNAPKASGSVTSQ